MSANGNGNGDDGEQIPGREIAYRLFAAEYDDASMSYAESDEERAPNYVVSPTGARLNRLFVVGTLTEVTPVNDEMVRARVVDPTGAFVVYAGQYQPDELATLEQLEPPAFVAVTGKARTFQPEDSDQVYTSIRPESIATVDADTRDRWVVSAAEQTRERVGTYAAAAKLDASAEPRSADSRAATPRDTSGDALTEALREAGVEIGLAAGVPLARGHYGTTPAYLEALHDRALEAVEVVADERDQVTSLSLQPDDSSPESDATFDSLADLAGVDLEVLEATEIDADVDSKPAEAVAATAGGSATEPDTGVDAGEESTDSGSAAGTATGTDRDTASEAESESADGAALEADSSTEAAGASLEAESDELDDAALEGDSSASTESDADEPTASFDESTDIDDADETDADSFEVDTDDADETEDDLGDFDADEGGMYEMDDEEREQLEEEFGAEFTTGSEVEGPGEAGIDVPEPDDEPADEPDSESDADALDTDESVETGTADDDLGEPPESGLEAESASDPEPDTAESESEPDDGAETEADLEDDTDEATDTDESESADGDDPLEDVDLQTYVVETMGELDDGDGADRSTLVETVADDTGASEDDIEDAIQDALMGGQCYEPDDETLKPI